MHSKWFSACTYLRFDSDDTISQMAWEPTLQKLKHVPIPETHTESTGFSSPFGYLAPKIMSHEMQGFLYLTLTHEKKSIPRNKLNRLFMQKLEDMAERNGGKVGDIKGAERKALKEATEAELIKKTIPDEVYINFIIDPKAKLIYFDGTSNAPIQLITKKLEQVDSSFKIRPFFDASLEVYLTQWLYDPSSHLPKMLDLDHEATLLNEDKAKATFSNQDLQSDEIINLIRHDKKVTELGLLYDNRLSFKLNNKGCVKRIKPQDVLLSDIGKGEELTNAIEEREAHWLIMTNTIAELLQWFTKIFEVNNDQNSIPLNEYEESEHTETATQEAADADHDESDEGLDDAMMDLADALGN